MLLAWQALTITNSPDTCDSRSELSDASRQATCGRGEAEQLEQERNQICNAQRALCYLNASDR